MDELHYSSLGAVCARIKSGELRARDVVAATLERIGVLDPKLHAYVMVLADAALARADELDKAREAGEMLGPLHGVPIALKDLLYTEGAAHRQRDQGDGGLRAHRERHGGRPPG